MSIKISDSELIVMDAMWEKAAPVTMAEIYTKLSDTGWDQSTVKTLVRRLYHKGAISQKKQGVYYYSPKISRQEYGAEATRNLINKLYRGSAKSLVAALVSDAGLTVEDVAELRTLLNGEEDNG